MVAKRKSTGKRLRFDVFKRDNFTCQYCGSQPPSVVLVIDHILPVCEGGDNEYTNLVTACETCNQGKAGKKLGNVSPRPDTDLEWLEMQQEIAELRRYQLAKAERDEHIKNIVEMLQETWGDYFNDDFVPHPIMIMRWLAWASPEQIEEAIKIASAKSYKLTAFTARLKYTAAILHNMTGTRKE
jgi:hypothetical protein